MLRFSAAPVIHKQNDLEGDRKSEVKRSVSKDVKMGPGKEGAESEK